MTGINVVLEIGGERRSRPVSSKQFLAGRCLCCVQMENSKSALPFLRRASGLQGHSKAMQQADGRAYSHVPVMLPEVMSLLDPKPGEVVVDGTAGLGGHSEAIAGALADRGLLLAIDQDPAMTARTAARLDASRRGNVRILVSNFSEMRALLNELGIDGVDGILLDLGVASPQIDDPARGFGYRVDGPLDMRMNPGVGESAEEWINRVPEKEMADVLWQYGEERFSRRIARAIVRARAISPLHRTVELADLIARAVPRGSRRLHPARRSFQAIRIFLNRETEHLDRFLAQLPALLNPKGRCVIISYHSLEDRRAKNAFREGRAQGYYELITRKPLRPSSDEVASNPRSRSARLRAVRLLAGGIAL